MSGHSKWSQIKRQKGAADIKRGQVFTKMANAIAIAAREGSGDPATNFKLRLAIEQARLVNMPKENIERAIERGLGISGALGQIESVVYEGYGPGKVALIIEAATDNRNRTTAEVKGVIERGGGHFAAPGAVSWMFADEGVISVAKDGKSLEEIFDLAADSGAEDVEEAGNLFLIYSKPGQLEVVKKRLTDLGLSPQNAQLSKKAATTIQITDSETAKKILQLIERLEELDDIQKVYANFDIPDNLLVGIQSEAG